MRLKIPKGLHRFKSDKEADDLEKLFWIGSEAMQDDIRDRWIVL